MQQYRPNRFSILPPVVKNVLIINGLLFLALMTFRKALYVDLNDILGLHFYKAEKFMFFQYVTYMFMHDNFGHLFFNMFAFWMFGNVLEKVWGSKRFLFYIFFTGIGAALIHTIVIYLEIQPTIQLIDNFIANPTLQNFQNFHIHTGFEYVGYDAEMLNIYNSNVSTINSWSLNPDDLALQVKVIEFIKISREFILNQPNVVGASGAVFGILLAFGMLFPNSLLYLYFAFPIKAKYFVIAYGILELYLGFANRVGDNVAHFAHLGGMLFGFILLLAWKKSRKTFY